ncbi:MAG: glycosyltransferase [Planctomycetota bacterium]
MSASQGSRYLLVTPCRDEADHAQRTIDSVVAQTVQPAKWIIVDDGSTDGTPEILARAAAAHDWIQIVRREDRGKRSVGPGVIDAFYAGYETINPTDYGFVCKFDLDLDLPPEYFERVMQAMHADPRLGTFSGKPYFPPAVLTGGIPPTHQELLVNGAADVNPRAASPNAPASINAPHFDVSDLTSEACGDEMSVGMIKFYSRHCFEQIGGFVREVMWDGIDCHRCRMLGWKAGSSDDPALRFVHLRPMGSSHKGILTGRARHGFGQYFMGTGIAYMAASAVFRMSRKPVVIGGLAMFWGYLRSMLTRQPRYGDAAFRRFLRSYQWAALFKGKAKATAELDAAGAQRWTPPTPTTPPTDNTPAETDPQANAA